jgi:hypothetical protein
MYKELMLHYTYIFNQYTPKIHIFYYVQNGPLWKKTLFVYVL